MPTIAVHAFEGISMFHLATPHLVFGEVGLLGIADDWRVETWTTDGRPVRTAEGMRIKGPGGPEVLDGAELAVFPSWPSDTPPVDATLSALIADAHARGTQIASLCLGTFPVAASGILDGRTAVTHWAAAATLAQRHPRIRVDAKALYIDHGDVLTSAGTASGLDACLHLVRERLGSDAAAAVARHIVIAPHRDGGQAQYIERPVPQAAGDDAIADAQAWAIEHLAERVSVDDLARRACMSPRNFARRFLATTGSTPGAWVRRQRLDVARRLLETTRLSVAEVGRAAGFESAVTFRQRFAAEFATTPTSYRRRFGAGAASQSGPDPASGHPHPAEPAPADHAG